MGLQLIAAKFARRRASDESRRSWRTSLSYRVATRPELLQLVEEALDVIALAIDRLLPSETWSSGWSGWECWGSRRDRGCRHGHHRRQCLMGDGRSRRARCLRATARHAPRRDRCRARMRSWTGRPCASTRAWIFVVRPPRLQPHNESPFFYSGGMLMHAHDPTVDHLHVAVVRFTMASIRRSQIPALRQRLKRL